MRSGNCISISAPDAHRDRYTKSRDFSVTLKSGERRRIEFRLDECIVKYWNAQLRNWVVDPGTFDVWVGASAAAQAKATFETVGKPRRVRLVLLVRDPLGQTVVAVR